MGWQAIIYLAVLAGIDNQLYEAADIDGVSQSRKFISITLPSIATAIINTPIIDYVEEMTVRFIIGNKDLDKDWDADLKELDDLNLAEVLSLYNSPWDHQ